MKKLTHLLIGVAAAAMVLEGGAITALAEDNVTISLLTRYGDDADLNAKVFREAVAAFQAEHPEITIEDKSITDETQFNNVFKISMATGDIPTIFLTYGGGNLKAYVENGIAADLTDWLEANQDWYDTFDPNMFSMLTYSDIDGIYGIPYNAYVDNLFINTNVLDAYGLEIPNTIEEFEAVCDALLAEGVVPMPVGDKSDFRGGHLFAYLMAKRTGTEFVKDLATGAVSYDCEEVRDVLTTMKSWAEKGYLGDSITTLDGEGEVQLFLTGQSAFIYRNVSFISRIVNDMEDNSGVVEKCFPGYEAYPENQNMWHGGSSDAFCIAADASEEEKEAAIALLKYVTRMEYFEERNEASYGAFVSTIKDLPALENVPGVTQDLNENLKDTAGMIVEPAEYDSVSGLENATRTAIQAMWAGASVDDTIDTIIDAKENGD